ncbi:ThyX-like thymidylate synthase [Microbacterium phage Rachella]|uniref:ThyX-like thymidylate synthase n=5 Tax=Krampusvirus krampus TaxID=2734242 RepID=A0A2Z4Q3R0_9CAUD|nr:ThyX-like thymidylate synthase [Microbacterium phage Krampus]AWY04509.1 ThyX-like thymidylate synthase [Microbacterium phage AnnaSerena]QCQ57415.1 ThyX-like thymidylate synthase [Microbacterium phage Rachella]QDF18105.1 ThyX-like thymidylate synthase [Microbacterium phage Anakin]QDF18187.1 ThyX-like thymidylate synthase [Microbacterium phage NarutoRun]UDG78673.1 ThyX-like thymidylate synthase [Microbacterium phage Neptune]UDL15532.1 ThyX-like thymidylate synthase [Microbacterium phage Cybe
MTSTELQKWADKSMFEAQEETDEIVVHMPSATHDPMGIIAMGALGYTGRTITDLRDITDEERVQGLVEMAKTILAAPTEFVSMHFVIEGIHRGLTHQMVRQRTAVYTQESMRFAVKTDPAKATALPPSLDGTLSLAALVTQEINRRQEIGLTVEPGLFTWMDMITKEVRERTMNAGGPQANRLRWDDTARLIGEAYLDMINNGMPAEDARGILPTNIKTKIQYDTKLRGFLEQMGARVSDQAQFEWRQIVRGMVMAMRDFGAANTYQLWVNEDRVEEYWQLDDLEQYGPVQTRVLPDGTKQSLMTRSQLWQWREISKLILPPDFKLGRRAFGASMDRPSRIAERVEAFAAAGVPSSQWLEGSPKHSIPPLHPDEWLLDPHSARLKSGQEFDIFGARVPEGEGWHWTNDEGGQLIRRQEDGSYAHARWPENFPLFGTKEA